MNHSTALITTRMATATDPSGNRVSDKAARDVLVCLLLEGEALAAAVGLSSLWVGGERRQQNQRARLAEPTDLPYHAGGFGAAGRRTDRAAHDTLTRNVVPPEARTLSWTCAGFTRTLGI